MVLPVVPRRSTPFAAGCIAAFGLVNAVAILASAAFLATALDVALEDALAPGGDAAATAQLMYVVSGNFWAVGGLFFGLWLVPMGCVRAAVGWMPRPLGWLLVVGGVGYVLSAFVAYARARRGRARRRHCRSPRRSASSG